MRTRWCVPVGSLVRTPGTRVSSSPCTARGDWALHPEDLSQTTVHPTESQSRPLGCLSCFLSWVGIRRPNLITELSGWPAPDSPLRTQEPVLDRRTAWVYSMLYLEGVIFGLRVSWRWVWGRQVGSCGVGLARDI